MINKIYKLFGIKVFEVVSYANDEAPLPKSHGKAQGEVLSYTPLEAKRDEDKKIIDKMEGHANT